MMKRNNIIDAQDGKAVIIVLILIVLAGLGGWAYVSNQNELDAGVVEITSLNDDGSEQANADSAAEEGNKNPVVAVFNGDDITRQDVVAFIENMHPQMQQIPLQQLFPMAIEQMINNRIVDEKSKNAALERDPDVQKQLEEIKKQIIRAKFVENTVSEKMTDERLKKEYDNYVANFPDVDEVKAAHILVEDEKLAKEIIAKLNKGEDFATLANEKSIDGSGQNGGDLGYFVQSDVVPEFADVAFATEVGSYTKEPVKSQFGYHIIRVDDKRKREPETFEQIKPYMEQEMHRMVLQETIEAWQKDFTIERFDINGNPLPEDGVAHDTAPEVVETAQEGNAEETADTKPAAGEETPKADGETHAH